jgi:hypothetical protein
MVDRFESVVSGGQASGIIYQAGLGQSEQIVIKLALAMICDW